MSGMPAKTALPESESGTAGSVSPLSGARNPAPPDQRNLPTVNETVGFGDGCGKQKKNKPSKACFSRLENLGKAKSDLPILRWPLSRAKCVLHSQTALHVQVNLTGENHPVRHFFASSALVAGENCPAHAHVTFSRQSKGNG